jgi:prepilin-type processing-associated H-X9-DG protein
VTSPFSHGRGAFTLVELLVVIGIIACLVAIIMPGVGQVRRVSRSLACQSNIKHLYAASLEFCNEHKGQFPLPVKIPSSGGEDPVGDPLVLEIGSFPLLSIGLADLNNGKFWKYIGNSEESRRLAVWCPDDNAEGQFTGSGNKGANRNFSYSYNSLVRTGSFATRGTINRSKVVFPAERIYIMEEVGPNDTYAVMRDMTGASDDDRPSARHGTSQADSMQYNTPGYNNSGMSNFGFFDGHVESLPTMQFNTHPEYYNPLK